MARRECVGSLTAVALVVAQVAPATVAAPLALALAAPAAAQALESVEIQCYSEPGQQNSCPLPPGTRAVSFKGPDRSLRCREGQTWRRRGQSLWVANGCGGIFEAAVQRGGPDGSGGGWGGEWGGGWGGSGGSGGEITCRSINNREQRCSLPARGSVSLVRQLSDAPCIEGQTWRSDGRSVWVRDGCQAVFAYGSGNWGGGGSGGWGSGFAGELRCRSNNNRYNRCNVMTQGRVQLVERYSRADCVEGRTWGYDARGIWVDRGCEARFAYGRGSYQPQFGGSGGSADGGRGGGGGSGVAAGLLGAGLAAGLIAILTSRGEKHDSSRSPSALQADYGLFPAAAQTEARACMAEGARQLGASGATAMRLDRVIMTERRGAGWHLVTEVTGNWPRETTRLRLDCTATAERVSAFDVSAL